MTIQVELFVRYLCKVKQSQILSPKMWNIFTPKDKIEFYKRKYQHLVKYGRKKKMFKIFSSVDNFITERNHSKTVYYKNYFRSIKHPRNTVLYIFYVKY